jgi:hypothetical protein
MAVGVVRSSSIMRSSLRSISSRRRRIRERLSAEVMAEEEAPSSGWGAIGDRASVGRADFTQPLHSAVVGEGACSLLLTHHLQADID